MLLIIITMMKIQNLPSRGNQKSLLISAELGDQFHVSRELVNDERGTRRAGGSGKQSIKLNQFKEE